jgi:hypothetical protein
MKEQFIERNFARKRQVVIDQMNAIIDEYQDRGFVLTVRQLFYQFVARGLIKNSKNDYKRFSNINDDARMAGVIDWDAIEDRTRNLVQLATWESPSEILESAAASYREDLWLGQKFRPEVFIEKDALVGVIDNVCRRWRVSYLACRGYNSASAQYRAANRCRRELVEGRTPIILNLGDHDPEGLDMTRDLRERFALMVGQEIEVRRLALNMDQIEQYQPPPNFAKESSTRIRTYRQQYGEHSWELDALTPDVIAGLVETAIRSLIDLAAWRRAEQKEKRAKAQILRLASEWRSR